MMDAGNYTFRVYARSIVSISFREEQKVLTQFKSSKRSEQDTPRVTEFALLYILERL